MLLPPGSTVVAHEVVETAEGRIVVGRQHLTMRVDIYALPFALFEQHHEVVKIMSANEYAGTITYSKIHMGDNRIAVVLRVGGIEECHRLDSVFANLQCEAQQFVGP